MEHNTETERPATTSNPFEISKGILVKGTKNIGKKTITTKSDQKEALSSAFDIYRHCTIKAPLFKASYFREQC